MECRNDEIKATVPLDVGHHALDDDRRLVAGIEICREGFEARLELRLGRLPVRF